MDCLKLLLQKGADFNKKDSFDNSILHIAAINGNNKMIDYISKNVKIDIFGRNVNGETALNICIALKNAEG